MNIDVIYNTIQDYSNSHSNKGEGFAVFTDRFGELSVMHLTHRRGDILNKDLKNKHGLIRKQLCGVYDRFIDIRDLRDDCEFTLKELNHV